MYRTMGKRLIDIAGSAAALIVFAPLLVLVALLIRIKMGSPVLFRQLRPGLGGRPFTLIKFRTMTVAAGGNDSDAARLGPIGAALRSSSIDELPELWNVIKGDMSLVGPRPLLMQYLPLYTAQQARRHEVRPGITGWAQVNGRNLATWSDRFARDVWYVDHVTLWLDAVIVWRTLRGIVRRDGISAEGHVTMPPFTGGA